MTTIHFDVDTDISPHLSGKKLSYSLQDVSDKKIYETADIISIKSASRADKIIFNKFKKLKLLITRTVGMDHIDLDYCKQKGIEVRNIVDYGAFNIAEHVFALLLTGARNILSVQKEIKKGVFSYRGHLGVALKGKVLGVVGTGKIGLEVIKRANAFEMKTIAYDVFLNEKAAKELGFPYVTLDELVKKSDVITLHAPLLESTKHMINDATIKQMKNDVILINTARGGLIDTKALIKNIKKFRFVGLDVLEDEAKFAKNHPLLKYDNVAITPHIAFFSDASVKKIGEETEKIIKELLP